MDEMMFATAPIWVVFLASMAFFFFASEAGFWVGRRRRRDTAALESGSTGLVTGSILGLVSFLLAFSYSIAAGNYSERRGAVLDEANAIGTAYLRADLLPQAAGSELKALLREYTRIRVAATQEDDSIGQYIDVIRSSEAIHGQIWQLVAQIARQDPTAINGLVISAVNEVFDMHSIRVAVGARQRIPATIWIVLYFVSTMALATTGYRFGASFGVRSELLPGMVLAIACVIALISDLDNPRHGFLLSDQTPMQNLMASMSPESS